MYLLWLAAVKHCVYTSVSGEAERFMDLLMVSFHWSKLDPITAALTVQWSICDVLDSRSVDVPSGNKLHFQLL